MHYAYVLQSEMNKDVVYIGNTNDLQRRLIEHNNGSNYSTRKNKPFRYVYYEAYLDK
jgi:predicted GIY-YIG superfamily endonuclease